MTHFYSRDGKLVKPGTGLVSPTTVLAIRRNIGLQGWKDFVGADEAERLSDIAKKQGTLVHRIVQRLVEGETLLRRAHLTEPVQLMVGGFERWATKYRPTHMEAEKFVLSDEDEYGGRLDLLCQLPTGAIFPPTGEPSPEWWIIDFKTSKLIRPSMGLQLVGYKKALLEMTTSPKLRKQFNYKGEPINARMGILQLTDQIQRGYRFKEFDEPYEVFKAHITIFKWEQINEPPDYPWDGGLIYI